MLSSKFNFSATFQKSKERRRHWQGAEGGEEAVTDGEVILDDDALDDLFDELHDEDADDGAAQSRAPPAVRPPAPAARGKGADSTPSVDGSGAHSSRAAAHSSSRTGSTNVRMDVVEAKLRAEDGGNSDVEGALTKHGQGGNSMKASFGVILRTLDDVNDHARSCMLSDGHMQVLPSANTSSKVYVCAHPQLARFPRLGKRKATDLVRVACT